MEQTVCRKRAKVAGVFAILLALNELLNFLLYFVRVVQYSGIPAENLIRNLVMLSALAVIVIQAMRNKSGVVLFVAVTVYTAAFQWFTLTGIIRGTTKPNVYTYIMLLSLVSLIVVAAFSAFKCDRLVRYTWYLPVLITLVFALGYYAYNIEYYADLFSIGLSFEDYIYRGSAANNLFLRPVFVLYLMLWLKSMADERLRRETYRW